MSSLVALSGGMDSALVLYELAKHTNQRILVLHIDFRKSFEPYYEQERRAAKRVFGYCDAVRPLQYVETGADFRSIKTPGSDELVVLHHSMAVARSFNLFDIGWAEDPITAVYAGNRPTSRWERSQESYDACYTMTVNALNTHFGDRLEHAYTPVALCLPMVGRSKKEIMEALPEDLRELTWSCRTPDRGKPCGRCWSCEEINEAI